MNNKNNFNDLNSFFSEANPSVDFENYGTPNIWNNGKLIRKKMEDNHTVYEILLCKPYEDSSDLIHSDLVSVVSTSVNISASFINIDEVMEKANFYFPQKELALNECCRKQFACACLDVYGLDSFHPIFPYKAKKVISNSTTKGCKNYFCEKREAIQFLLSHGVRVNMDGKIQEKDEEIERLVAHIVGLIESDDQKPYTTMLRRNLFAEERITLLNQVRSLILSYLSSNITLGGAL